MSDRRGHFRRGVICTLLGATLWGFSGTCAQFLLSQHDVPATYITCVRMIGSGVLFLAVLAVRRRQTLCAMAKDPKALLSLAVFGVFGLFAGQITYITAIGHTNAGTATVLQCTGIAFVMVFTCLKARRVPRVREVIGLVLAVGSTFVIATHGDPATLSLPFAGLVWGLASGVAAAFYVIYPKLLFERWGSFAVTGLGMVFGGIVAVSVAQPGSIAVELDAAAIAALGAIVVVGTFGAFSLYLKGVADIGPMRASLLSAIEPVSATVFSWAWLGTRFPLVDCVGFAMMIAIVFFVTTDKPESSDLAIVEVPVGKPDAPPTGAVEDDGPDTAVLAAGGVEGRAPDAAAAAALAAGTKEARVPDAAARSAGGVEGCGPIAEMLAAGTREAHAPDAADAADPAALATSTEEARVSDVLGFLPAEESGSDRP